MYIHELNDWPRFHWSAERITEPLASTRHQSLFDEVVARDKDGLARRARLAGTPRAGHSAVVGETVEGLGEIERLFVPELEEFGDELAVDRCWMHWLCRGG